MVIENKFEQNIINFATKALIICNNLHKESIFTFQTIKIQKMLIIIKNSS
jgi:hypothetical protein